jgi:hypothetical protein
MTNALAAVTRSGAALVRNRRKRLLMGPLCSRFVFCILFIILMAFTVESCDESTRPGNHGPVISDIEADPPRITVSDTVSLRAIATDADGDSLSFAWTVTSGELIDSTGVSVRWITPSHSGEYEVTVRASDQHATAEKTKLFSTEGVLIKGYIGGVWTKDYNPYIVIGDCEVYYLDDLLLKPGVEIRVRGPWKITVCGGFYARGTEEEPVVLTSDRSTPRPGDWVGLEFALPEGPGPPPELPWYSELRWTVIEYAETGVSSVCGSTAPTVIKNCLIRRNSEVGVFAAGGPRDLGLNVVIEDTRICENGRVGVICDASPWSYLSETVLKRCVISDNGHSVDSGEEVCGGIYCYSFGGEIDSCSIVRNGVPGNGPGIRFRWVRYFKELHNCILEGNAAFDLECLDYQGKYDPQDEKFDATGNYWGQVTTAEMEAGVNPKNISAIYDNFDDIRLWEVDYSGWLTQAPYIPDSWPKSRHFDVERQ